MSETLNKAQQQALYNPIVDNQVGVQHLAMDTQVEKRMKVFFK